MTLSDFNLLGSTSRGYEDEASSEIWFLLGAVGDGEPLVEKSGVSGLIIAKTALDPFRAIEGLRKLLKQQPWEFRYILRVIPIEVVVRTKLEEIGAASLELSSKIEESETFRVTIEKRHTELSTKGMIEAVAANINRKVNLSHPDRIVLIEVLGGLTGVSVIKPDDILSIAREKPC